MSRAALLLSIVLLVVPVAAWAKIPPSAEAQAAMRQFRQLDRSGAGTLSYDDFAAGRAHPNRLFALLDANGDGTLSAKEFVRGPQAAARRGLMRQLDLDADGRLTLQEFAKGYDRRLFAVLADAHGRITPDALRAGLSNTVAPPAAAAAAVARVAGSRRTVSCWVPLHTSGHVLLVAPMMECR